MCAQHFHLSFPLSLQAEPEGFSHFHLYVCAAFLVRWRKEILDERDFQVMCARDTGGAINLCVPTAEVGHRIWHARICYTYKIQYTLLDTQLVTLMVICFTSLYIYVNSSQLSWFVCKIQISAVHRSVIVEFFMAYILLHYLPGH